MTREELEYWKAVAPSSFEKQELGKVWKDAGLSWLGWQNGVPMFDPDTDMEKTRALTEKWRKSFNHVPEFDGDVDQIRVQEIAEGSLTQKVIKETILDAPAPVHKKRPKRSKKGGAVNG